MSAPEELEAALKISDLEWELEQKNDEIQRLTAQLTESREETAKWRQRDFEKSREITRLRLDRNAYKERLAKVEVELATQLSLGMSE
eukprot:TRINITY_DN3477_c0_g1_i1.p1 TRINITY_DN3477_c0_g1~~TRINITY_DN3477_c0_g1_i1.p1  ORF type:complete len:87 (+),score=11.15 TRINITY_DN3477_c0_g1_i1:79-339(+)